MTRRRLPEILHEIASVIGHDAMMKLVDAVGGTRFYIPASVTKNHFLVKLLGMSIANKLCDHFAVSGPTNLRRGGRIEIPMLNANTYYQAIGKIHDDIAVLDEQQKSAREIARSVGVTQRTIHRRRQRDRALAGQKSR